MVRKQKCSMHELSAMIGRMNQMARIGLWEAPLYYRALQRNYTTWLHAQDWLSHAIPTDPDYPQPSVVDRTRVVDFTRFDRTQQDVLTTPANRQDDYHRGVDQTRGSSLFRNKDRGQWSSSEAMLHINYMELNSGGAHKQEGRNTFIKANSIGPRYLDILSVTSMWRWIIHLDISTTAQSGR